jgi:hypothetical protein
MVLTALCFCFVTKQLLDVLENPFHELEDWLYLGLCNAFLILAFILAFVGACKTVTGFRQLVKEEHELQEFRLPIVEYEQ